MEVAQVVADPAACADGGRGGNIRRKAHSRREGPHKEFLKKGHVKRPQRTGQGWWLSVRSIGIKSVLSSSSANAPSPISSMK